MSIDEKLEKIKPFYTAILLVVIGSILFALGRLSIMEKSKTGIRIEYPNTKETSSVIVAISSTTSAVPKSKIDTNTVVVPAVYQSSVVIGSKSGKKYYFPWCGTVKRIKPENQVHFASIEQARAAGFTPGGNCKGLK